MIDNPVNHKSWTVDLVRLTPVVCRGPDWGPDWGFFSSSARLRSSGTHTGKPLGLCISERPEGSRRRHTRYDRKYNGPRRDPDGTPTGPQWDDRSQESFTMSAPQWTGCHSVVRGLCISSKMYLQDWKLEGDGREMEAPPPRHSSSLVQTCRARKLSGASTTKQTFGTSAH